MNHVPSGIFNFYTGYKKLVIVFLLLGLTTFLAFESRDKDDFYIFLKGSVDFMEGKNMYAISYSGFHFLYSCFFAILIYPLNYLPFELAKFLWLALNAFLLYRICRILISYAAQYFTTEKKFWFTILIFLCALRFILDNFHYAQSTILILYMSLQGLEWIRKEKPVQGAAFIALGINIKLLPLVFTPYLLYRAYFKATALVVLFCIAMYAIPIEFVGYDHYSTLMQTWWGNMNPSSKINVLDVDEVSFHGLSTLLSTLFEENVPDVYALPLKRNIADVSLDTLSLIINLTRGILIAFTLYFLKFPPFKKAMTEQNYMREIAYLFALIPLIFPHQQHYAFLFMLPAMCYILSLLMNQHKLRFRRIILVLFVFIVLVFNLKVILGEFNAYYEHFKIITYAGLLVLFLLYLVKP